MLLCPISTPKRIAVESSFHPPLQDIVLTERGYARLQRIRPADGVAELRALTNAADTEYTAPAASILRTLALTIVTFHSAGSESALASESSADASVRGKAAPASSASSQPPAPIASGSQRLRRVPLQLPIFSTLGDLRVQVQSTFPGLSARRALIILFFFNLI